MISTKSFFEDVKRSQSGQNKGIPFSVKHLTNVVGGILKGTYYLILGKSKTGKSSFLYDEFIFHVLDLIKDGKLSVDDYDIYLYSYEIGEEKILYKAAARWIYSRADVLTDIKQLSGAYGKAHPDLYEYIFSPAFSKYLEMLNKILHVKIDGTPQDIYEHMYKVCVEASEITGYDEDGFPQYTFKNPKHTIVVSFDHFSLVKRMPKATIKDTIDALSKNLLRLKRMFGLSIAALQQITPKEDNGKVKVTHGHGDVRDSKNTFQDSDVCISLGSPYHEEIKSTHYRGGIYHVQPDESNGFVGLEDRLRLISIEKDRYGNSGYRLVSGFIGEIGMFTDLALPDEVDYDHWQNLKKTYEDKWQTS